MSTTSPRTCRTHRTAWSGSSGPSNWPCNEIREANVSTRWSSAAVLGAPSDPLPTDPDWAGGSLYTDERKTTVRAAPEALWRVIEGIGGQRGWYSFPLAWNVRGIIDRFVGGVGLRRGGAILIGCTSASHSTSGESKRSTPDGCCDCARRCGYPASLGSKWAWRAKATRRSTHNARSSTTWVARPSLLVGDLAVPWPRLRRHDTQHRTGG